MKHEVRNVLRGGAVVLLCGCALMSVPLLLVGFEWNKYFVAFGFVLACVGLSILTHGVWDWLSRG